MKKIYILWIIFALIALGYSAYQFFRPISSEDIKPFWDEFNPIEQKPTTSASEGYKLPPKIPAEIGKDKG